MVESDHGTLKALVLAMPERIRFWAALRMVWSGQWAVEALQVEIIRDLIGFLPLARDQYP